MDLDVNRAASLASDYGAEYFTTDPAKLLDDPKIRLIYISSNHASHATYAVDALRAGKAVHIEKPHAVRMDQLDELLDVMLEPNAPPVNLGFNRPDSALGRQAIAALDREDGAAMLNWFVAGHEIPPDHWYFAPEEGGRVLGNLCHWIDFIYRCVPEQQRFPIRIRPTSWEKSDCDISVSYVFGEGTIGTITFSAKGHAFEGVREHFSAHKGMALIGLEDFGRLRIDAGPKRRVARNHRRYRDHGHELNIGRSYRMAHGEPSLGRPAKYVYETGLLALETKRALENNEEIVVAEPPLTHRRFNEHQEA